MKICTKCQTPKEENEFPWLNGKHEKRVAMCKVCQRPYKKKHHANNRHKQRARNKESHRRYKEFVDNYKSKKGCVFCPEKEACCIDFHHLNSEEKVESVSLIWRRHSIPKLMEEISKCVTLCSNCHRKLHAGLIDLG